MQDLGRAALALAFGLVVSAAIGGGLGAYTRRRRLVASARNALYAAFGASAVAAIVLLNAFRIRDFSFAYVAEHSSKALPFPYVYSAFGGGQAGSLLLWFLVLTGLGSAAVAFNRRLTTEVLPWTVPVLGAVASFFALLLVFVVSPFTTQVAPADGAGLNPSLQNPYMMIHPPLLYLGYVGLTIPFAFAAGALLSGRFDERWFVGFIALAATFSTALILWRLPLLRARTKLESLASREAAFLYNNLLLVAFTLTVLWGVAFPLLSEAVRGEAVTVGPPYYDFFLKVFGLPLLLLMGIGPLVAWRRTSLRALGETVLGPALAALGGGLILIALGAGSSTAGLLAYTFSAFALAAIVHEFARGTRARKALGAPSWWAAFSGLVARNRRRYGGYLVHDAIVLLL